MTQETRNNQTAKGQNHHMRREATPAQGSPLLPPPPPTKPRPPPKFALQHRVNNPCATTPQKTTPRQQQPRLRHQLRPTHQANRPLHLDLKFRAKILIAPTSFKCQHAQERQPNT
ncbi:hypothetical protein L484_018606 [Morus notabilis]|uniref:Uncharacterized protein n=1 Tax=Morus notabilis TaxID=981085 RepID=W9R6Y9_9ROSA|nr:hypothetical protein L484_018606 [Morus notabilis]